MQGKGKPLIFRAWTPGDAMDRAVWGIAEPKPDKPNWEPDILLVPLLAFDGSGWRLGYGGGFYDRTLRGLRARKPIVAVGLAYDEQHVDAVPHLDYDERLDWVLRPSGPIKCAELMMRLLFLGDVVGRSGRKAVIEELPRLRARYKLDFVAVNGENAAGGFGITEAILEELLDAGADVVTLGNHSFDQKEALVFIERHDRLLRPINYPPGTPGRGPVCSRPPTAPTSW